MFHSRINIWIDCCFYLQILQHNSELFEFHVTHLKSSWICRLKIFFHTISILSCFSVKRIFHIFSSLFFVVGIDFPKNSSRGKERFPSVWRGKSDITNQIFLAGGGCSNGPFSLSLRSTYWQHSKKGTKEVRRQLCASYGMDFYVSEFS